MCQFHYLDTSPLSAVLGNGPTPLFFSLRVRLGLGTWLLRHARYLGPNMPAMVVDPSSAFADTPLVPIASVSYKPEPQRTKPRTTTLRSEALEISVHTDGDSEVLDRPHEKQWCLAIVRRIRPMFRYKLPSQNLCRKLCMDPESSRNDGQVSRMFPVKFEETDLFHIMIS